LQILAVLAASPQFIPTKFSSRAPQTSCKGNGEAGWRTVKSRRTRYRRAFLGGSPSGIHAFQIAVALMPTSLMIPLNRLPRHRRPGAVLR